MVHSARDDAAAPRRSRVFVAAMLALALTAMSSAGSARVGAATATSEVFIVLGGYGDITVAGGTCAIHLHERAVRRQRVCAGGRGGDDAHVQSDAEARHRPATGRPAAQSPVASLFRGWSRPECTSIGPCTVKATDSEEWIVARFSPVWLEASVQGSGTITVSGKSCSLDRCVMGLFDAGTRVTVTASPTTAGATTRWGYGCDPYESDLNDNRCVVNIANVRNFVSVGFGGFEPNKSPPFNKTVNLRVTRSGDGQGQVQGGRQIGRSECRPVEDRLWHCLRCPRSWLPDHGAVACGEGRPDPSSSAGRGPPCSAATPARSPPAQYPKVVAVFRKSRGQQTWPSGRPSRRRQQPGDGRHGRLPSGSPRTAPLVRACCFCGTDGRSDGSASTSRRAGAG